MSKKVDKYILGDVIGKGNFAVVQKATHQTKSGQFAIKVISNTTILQNAKLQECLINQVQALSKVENCEYIIKYYEMIRTKNNFYFVYQYCNGGNLHEYLKNRGPLPQKKALSIFKQLIQAFKVLNRLNVMHRDLKPQNIFLHDGKAKLGDFGFCKALKLQENMAKTMLGSPLYMAPQVLKGQQYTVKADVWSLGVILYEMIYGFCPFQSASIAMLVSNIANTQLCFSGQQEVSQKTKNLIRKMLNKDYAVRSNWIQLFNQSIDLDGNFTNFEIKDPFRDYNKKEQKNIILTKKDSFLESDQKETPKDNINKENKVKSFYSQKYMDLLALSQNNTDKLRTPMKSSYKRDSLGQKLRDKEIPKINIQKQRTVKQCVKIYKQCGEIMNLMRQQLKQQNIITIPYSYLVLSKVHQQLEKICELLGSYQGQYLQFINTLQFQIIHINKQKAFIKDQLKRLNIVIPLSNNYSSVVNFRIMGFINQTNSQALK